MKYPKQELTDLAFCESEHLHEVARTFIEQRRWVTVFGVVFEDDRTGRHYYVPIEMGSTEVQESVPFEYGPDEVEVDEVKLVEVTVDKWMPVKPKEPTQ